MRTRVLLPWQRLWTLPHGKIHRGGRDGGGFLTDPETFFGRSVSEETFTIQELSARRCLVLCGEPGSGKTSAIESFLNQVESAQPHTDARHVIFEEMRSIPDTGVFQSRIFKSSLWKEWIDNPTSNLTLVIDGIDEGQVKIPGFVAFLTEELRRVPVARLRLILLCRTLDWPWTLGRELFELWSQNNQVNGSVQDADEQSKDDLAGRRKKLIERNAVFEICPLMRKDAFLAASETSGVNPEEFLKAVSERRVEGLAARPVTLFMLLDEFKRGGNFAGGYRELYRRHIRALCEEPDQGRVERLRPGTILASPEQLRRTSSRLAALYLLCGRSAFFLGRTLDAQTGDLTVDDCIDEPGINAVGGGEVFIDRSHVEQALRGTSLFWAKGEERYHFAHQTFAEALGAEFLTSLPLSQLRQILCVRGSEGERVVPQLSQLAAWIAAEHRDWFMFLLENEPEALLRSDLGEIAIDRRKMIVDAFLRRAEREEFFDHHEKHLFFSALKHAELAEQLWSYLSKPELNIIVRRLALEIAVECKAYELLPRLIELVQLGDDPTLISHFVTPAISELTTPANAEGLIPIVKKEENWATLDDERFRHACLLGLMKTTWSLSDALDYLGEAQDRLDGVGYQIAECVKPGDLIPILDRLSTRSSNSNSLQTWLPIVSRVCVDALARVGEADVRLSLARFCLMQLRQRSFGISLPDDFVEELSKDVQKRRALLHEMLEISGSSEIEELLWALPEVYIRQSDFGWAVANLQQSLGSKSEFAWAAVVGLTFSIENSEVPWGQLIELAKRSERFREQFGWCANHSTREGALEAARKDLEERRRQNAALYPSRPPRPPAEEIIAADLTSLSKGQHESWIHLFHHLFLRDKGEDDVTPLAYDVTTAPGWTASDEARRKAIYDGARGYLLNCKHLADLPNGAISNVSAASYGALFLLRDELEANLALRETLLSTWAPTVINWYGFDNDSHPEMVKIVYRIAPVLTIQALVGRIDRDSKLKGGSTMALGPFKLCWGAPLNEAVSEFVSKGKITGEFLGYLLDQWIELDLRFALEVALAILRRQHPYAILGAAVDTRGAALSRLLVHSAPHRWTEIKVLLEEFPEECDLAIGDLADGNSRLRKTHFIRDFSEGQIAELYLLVLARFPNKTDPPFPKGAYIETTRFNIARFKENLLSVLVSRGTQAACDELRKIANVVLTEERIWIRWRLNEAQENWRRGAWQKVDPITLLRLARRSESRMVRDEDELVELLKDSLDRFQRRLTQSMNPTVARLWNYEGRGTHRHHFAPKDEDDLSREISTWFEEDLSVERGIVLNREVHLRPGHRTDILIDSIVPRDGDRSRLTVVVEVKCCWNDELKTALKGQLVDRYLTENKLTHGIYVVGWFDCSRWDHPERKHSCKLIGSDYKELCKEVAALAVGFDGQIEKFVVISRLLDCRYPNTKS